MLYLVAKLSVASVWSDLIFQGSKNENELYIVYHMIILTIMPDRLN